tara:strand:- start:2763 stop:3002 length:240 start_codon:yes stop_codon:yes gene_type:complete
MTWTGFYRGIQDFFEGVAFAPYNALRELELSSWWAANSVSWVFMIICAVAIVYWIGQLKKYDATEGSDDKSVTAHRYLG